MQRDRAMEFLLLSLSPAIALIAVGLAKGTSVDISALRKTSDERAAELQLLVDEAMAHHAEQMQRLGGVL